MPVLWALQLRQVTKSIPRVFWQNGTGGLLNHSDFFGLLAQNVRVHCADILSLDQNLIRLQSGDEIVCDAILCGTGWVPSLHFFSRDQLVEHGLPHALSDENTAEREAWAELEAAADHTVLSRFFQLANPPRCHHKPATQTPYRLYNPIAPFIRYRRSSLHRVHWPHLRRLLLSRRGGTKHTGSGVSG